MYKFAISTVILMLGTTANAQQVSVPMTLAEQAQIIPLLCDAAVYGYRAQFAEFCAALKPRLADAVKAEADAKRASEPPK